MIPTRPLQRTKVALTDKRHLRPLTVGKSPFAVWMDGKGLDYLALRLATGCSHASVHRWRIGKAMQPVYARLLKIRWWDAPLKIRQRP